LQAEPREVFLLLKGKCAAAITVHQRSRENSIRGLRSKAGDFVTSGAINLTSQLKVRAAKAGDKSFMYVMGKEIEKSLKLKPKIQRTSISR
jgi:hypothetical protein